MILLFLYLYSCVIGFFAIKESNEDFLFKFTFVFLSSFIVLFILKPFKIIKNTLKL